MAKIPIESQNEEEKEFIRKEIITPEKTETLEKVYQNDELKKIQKPPRVSLKIILLSIILSIIFGFLAGFFGALYLLINKEIKIPWLKKINLEELLPKKEIVLVQEKKISIVPEERLGEMIKLINQQLTKVFFYKKTDQTNWLKEIYLPQEAIGLGLVMTDDGWLMTYAEPSQLPKFSKTIIFTEDKSSFPVTKTVADSLTKVVFLKTGIKNLPVVKFAENDEIAAGKTLLIFNHFGELKITTISQPHYRKISQASDFIFSTEKFSSFIRIDQELGTDFIGSPAFNLNGSFVGFVADNDLILPTIYFKTIVYQVLKQEKIQRPFLGLFYSNLQDLIGLSQPVFKEIKKGVLVVQGPAPATPAFLAGFKKNDLILKLNQISLADKKDLTEMIQSFQPGQEIEFLVLRNGKEITIKAKLGVL